MVDELAGPVLQGLVHNLAGADQPMMIKIPHLTNEAEHADQVTQIVLDYMSTPKLQYTVQNLGQIPIDQYNHLPQNLAFWF